MVYVSGRVECVSGDLAAQRWQTAPEDYSAPSTNADRTVVEYSALVDLESARKGLLKGREDALAALDESTTPADQAHRRNLLALLTVVHTNDSKPAVARRLHLFALPPRSRDAISSLQQGLQGVIAYELPSTRSDVDLDEKAEYSLQASSGRLQQLFLGSIVTYDLSGTLPRLASTLPSYSGGYHSFVRISSDFLIASETNACGIYDTTYNSMQATVSVTEGLALGSNKKRKINGESSSSSSSLHFVSHFSDLGLSVALSGDTLVGLQINLAAGGRKRRQVGLLVDSLGKGVDETTRHQNETQAKYGLKAFAAQDEAWMNWRTKIDGFCAEVDVEGLEAFLGVELGLRRKEKANNPEAPKALTNGETAHDVNGNAESVSDDETKHDDEISVEWRFPKDKQALISRTNIRKALYCLSKIFALQHDEGDSEPGHENASLVVTLYSANVLKWLALTGFITSDVIQRALLSFGNVKRTSLRAGAVVRAIQRLDPGLGVMHELLSWPVYLDIQEVGEALKLVIQSLQLPSPGTQRITERGDELPGVDGELANEVALETDAAEEDLAFALASLNDGLAIRSYALRAIFARLHSFPPSRIIEALRSILTQQEILFFVQLLRIELADGRWTLRYVDGPDDIEIQDRPSDRSIMTIGSLLNTAIDAIGTSGWLVGLSGDSQMSTDEMLDMLHAEVSAALEGCLEAKSLGVYLNDFERFGNQLHDKENSMRKRKREVDPVKNPGFLVNEESEDPTLPLGFKVQRIDKTRLTAGGQVRVKSKGAIGREISMRVGKYSIDRIRV